MENNTQRGAEVQTMVIIPNSTLEQITESLKEVKNLILYRAKEEAKQEWLESEEARKLLGVSVKTWQNYRCQRVLPFSQFGRKIYVKRASIDEFLQGHTITK